MRGEEKNGSDFELIELVDVCRSYGYGDAESFALKNFSLTVKRGEFIMIMGPSGCGKTTLLNVLGLLDKPTAGTYYLNGKKVSRFSGRGKARLRAKSIGFIFQDFCLIPNLTVIENVALPLVYASASKTHRLIQASDTLSRFHLREREYFLPHQLSGGQKQRVAIARSLVSKPEIILADEPTGNLDSRSSHIVMEELRRIHSEGNTIIMVTHNPNLTTYATRVIHMLDGGIDEDIKTVSDEELPVSIHDRTELGVILDEDIHPKHKSSAKTTKIPKKSEKNSSGDIKTSKIIYSSHDIISPSNNPAPKVSTTTPDSNTPAPKTPTTVPDSKIPASKIPTSKIPASKIPATSSAPKKPAPKTPTSKTSAQKTPVTKTVRTGLYASGDPGFRIKERPSIEDLVSKEKK